MVRKTQNKKEATPTANVNDYSKFFPTNKGGALALDSVDKKLLISSQFVNGRFQVLDLWYKAVSDAAPMVNLDMTILECQGWILDKGSNVKDHGELLFTFLRRKIKKTIANGNDPLKEKTDGSSIAFIPQYDGDLGFDIICTQHVNDKKVTKKKTVNIAARKDAVIKLNRTIILDMCATVGGGSKKGPWMFKRSCPGNITKIATADAKFSITELLALCRLYKLIQSDSHPYTKTAIPTVSNDVVDEVIAITFKSLSDLAFKTCNHNNPKAAAHTWDIMSSYEEKYFDITGTPLLKCKPIYKYSKNPETGAYTILLSYESYIQMLTNRESGWLLNIDKILRVKTNTAQLFCFHLVQSTQKIYTVDEIAALLQLEGATTWKELAVKNIVDNLIEGGFLTEASKYDKKKRIAYIYRLSDEDTKANSIPTSHPQKVRTRKITDIKNDAADVVNVEIDMDEDF